MEIVKRLVLNKTPKNVPYGAICCAKNMMIDDTSSYLTNDIGFKVSFVCPNQEDEHYEKEYIVGAIPCTAEIVIFTYQPVKQNVTGYLPKSRIYRKKDSQPATLVENVNWNHTVGCKITGSYSYNYKDELIIAFSEYSDNTMIPLKSLNLDDFNQSQTYAIEENIPTYETSVNIKTDGSLVCGVYTFFVRFKLDEHNYTKWFQITGDINVVQPGLSKKYIHNYLSKVGNISEPKVQSQGAFTVNTNGISNKAIIINFTPGVTTQSEIQLGYIIKRNSEVLGRLKGTYTIESNETTIIAITNNTFIEDIAIDSFLESPHQFFNVKNVVNYNNRLYIANYKEYPVQDYSEAQEREQGEDGPISIDTFSHNAYSSSENNNNSVIDYRFNIYLLETEYKIRQGWTNTETILFSDIQSDADGYVTNPKSFMSRIAHNLHVKDAASNSYSWGDANMNFYWFLQKPNDNTRAGAICIAKLENDESAKPIKWDWNFDIPDYKVKITLANNTPIIQIEYGTNIWTLSNYGQFPSGTTVDTNCDKSCVLAYAYNVGLYHFGNQYAQNDPQNQKQNSVDSIEGDSAKTEYTTNGGGFMNYDVQIDVRDFAATARNAQGAAGRDVPDISTDLDVNIEDSDFLSGCNVRTLQPYQHYNFFVHYIRKDGSCTPGFLINTDGFVVVNNFTSQDYGKVIVPKFNITNPDSTKFIGYFISYEQVDKTVEEVWISNIYKDGDNPKSISITNAKYLYDLDTIRGTKIKIGGIDYNFKQSDIKFINNRLIHNHVQLKGLKNNSNINYSYPDSDKNKEAYLLKSIDGIYLNKTKTLYRLTNNIYDFTEDSFSVAYLPGFYTTEVIITYNSEKVTNKYENYIIDPAASHVLGFDPIDTNMNDSIVDYKIYIKPNAVYSDLPLDAMSIKQDYDQVALTLSYNRTLLNQEVTTKTELHYNCLVSPSKLHDLLELMACYSAKPSKSYTNYSSSNVHIFDKTIYRSDSMSDESLINAFRHFEPNNYRNIFENKGKIVNLVGIGLYLIVHTEYSIFVFDRSPKLTAKLQSDTPDTFDIDYQDIMPSNEGFGGLAEKEESILTKNGYIWYDRANKVIFKFESGKTAILSVDINDLIKDLDIVNVRFAEDIINSRLIICFKVNYHSTVNNVYTSTVKYLTLSYNFYTNTFISLHDYKFTNNYRTYNKSYIFDADLSSTNSILYEFDKDAIVDYKNLETEDNAYFPTYYVRNTDASEVSAKSYVDVMFNSNYFTIKSLETIRYVLTQIINKVNVNKVTEELLNRHFSGDELKIYTDETDSGDLLIAINPEQLNALNAYKLPHYDKGCWNLNYFRNNIVTKVTETEIRESAATFPTNADKLVDANSYSIPGGKYMLDSDQRSLIYGKYIVVRFIFNNNHKVKLDGVEIVTNPY